ncbi:MAG: hypothetical protein NXH95_07520 [Pseudomonadaceae bacterium]|nr:hypothetical protein [Pseudomonadaceae bacterium]
MLFGTLRGHLHALDALTGEPCLEFGTDGVVDLTIGVGDVQAGEYTLTSPPAIINNTLYIGSAIGDNRKVESERGIVRAVDILTGRILWSWDPIPRSPTDPARQTWQGNSADISGGGNAWAPLSADVERQLVHHDVWDYDTPAQPVLVDLNLGNGSVPALVQVTKTGMM